MAKTLEEITREYEEELKKKSKISALSLPTGKNNLYTVIFIAFLESQNLKITQKGILIHLFIRGGNLRVVKHSKNKIAKTLGLAVSTYSENITKLENLNYIKQYKKIIYGSRSKQADLIYIYPINDDTGLPIKSSEEEMEITINSIIQMLNKNSNKLFTAEKKYNNEITDVEDINDDEIFNFNVNLDEAIAVEKELNKNIKTVAHIAFMENPLLNLNDKVIYLYLLMRSGQYNVFFENKERAAAKLNISAKTLYNSINKLQELNYIIKFKRNHSITGEKSSDILYINNYNKFTGLPDVNEALMNYQLNISKKIHFPNYTLSRARATIPKKKSNEFFTKNIKDLLYIDENISSVYYDTFVSDIKLESLNDVITLYIPKHLNAVKNEVVRKLEPLIIKYAKVLLKTNEELFLQVKIENKNEAFG